MKRILNLLVTAACAAVAWPSMAAYYVAGDFQGWNPGSSIMTETSPGSGIWQETFTALGASTRHEFKITQGSWGTDVPTTGNSWLYSDPSGNVTITFDANTYADGFAPSPGRIGVNVDPGTWTAVGDWQGWNNANLATAMTAQGGGVYELAYAIGTPGTYQYKAVDTGSWDAIGTDSRGVNANTWSFTTTVPNQTVDFYVNALNGSIKADVLSVPEPSSLALFGLAGLMGMWRLRRRS